MAGFHSAGHKYSKEIQMLYSLWKSGNKESSKLSSITVSNYGGGVVNIISQIPVSLKLGKTECSAMIEVQKGSYAVY